MRLTRSDLELEVLVNRIDRGELDLQPDYQRGEVWDRTRRQRLVDTILRGWYVPAVHIVRDDKLGRDLVLDGQQRLRTIHAFLGGDLPVAGAGEPMRDDILQLDGLHFPELPQIVQRQVRRFELTVVTLFEYSPEEPSELFFRLNQQYALSPPEKRNALFGVARDQVKKLVYQLEEEGLFSRETLGFSNGRLAYDDVIARFCLALQDGHLRRQVSNQVVEDFYRKRSYRDDVLENALNAASQLGQHLHGGVRVKFNKATLFSWLVFYYSMAHRTGSYPSRDFLPIFEELRLDESARLAYSPLVAALMQLYSDRGSYRVLDISSVLIRDFTLHAIYSLVTNSGDGRALGFLDAYGLAESPERAVTVTISQANWGDLP
ncbi:DUF262 domain-containing protein [Micromonospora sp. NPDC051296]|uniref:DUF262 domain-containing protein n=1 Tax=Micromonospora sp. NPDC051296 TaxID=3155046 RepID=UPI0034176ECB